MKKRLVFIFGFMILLSYGVFAQQITVQLGPEEIVFDWTTQKCNSWDVPDAPARAFRDINNQIQLLVTNTDNRRFIGSSLNNIALNCQSTLSSSLNSNPSQYNDHEWIASVYTLDGQTVHALVHNEYHGYLYNSACNNNYWACWYNAITYAKSTNAGVNYAQVATPNHLVASIPYQYVSNVGSPYGYYNPSNIIFKEGYYYSFVHTFEYMSQPSGACPMRTQNIADPTSWRYWDGAGFNNIPVNPYLTTTNPGSHLCQPIDPQDLKRIATSLTYNNYLDKYIMLGTEVTGYLASEQGFFYSVSDDLLNWEPLQLLMSTTLPGTPAATTSDMWYAYPSLLEETPSRNFEVTGRTPYLYYTRKNPNTPPIGAAQGFDRDLVRRQVTFTISSPPPQFDFSISNSGSINLAHGSSSSNTINANLISGTAQPVTFSVNGLPQGAIHSFSSNSCSPICSVQLMITATSSTPAGNYLITVTGNGGGITKTITFTLGVSDTTPPSAPSPHYGSAISQSSVQLAWGAATDNVGVTGYLVDVSTSASFANYVSGWQGNNVGNILSNTISNLNPGTTYYSRVRARDAAGNIGAHSLTISTTTLPQAAPFNFGLSITNPSSVSRGNNMSVSAMVNLISGTAQPVTFSVGLLPVGVTATINPQSCTASCSVNIILSTSTNTPVQTHTVLINAVGGGLTKTLIFSFAVTFLVDTVLPSAPSSIYSNVTGQNSIQIAWGAATDNVGVTGYLVDVSTSASFANYVSGWQGNNVGNILSNTISNLNPGTTYYSRVRARDAAGNIGDYITATPINTLQQTIPLQLPTLPLVTNITYDYTTNFISLIWIDSLYEQEYVLERSQENNPFVSIANLSADTTSYQDVSVSQNKNYLYRISAVNSAGVSAYSFGGITTIATVNYPTNTQPTTAQTQSTGSTTWPQSNSLLINQTSINSSGALQVSSYRTYLWIGALAFVLLALIIVLVKMFRRNRNSN